MSMEDLLKGILAEGRSRQRGQRAASDPLADLLGGILGGVEPQQARGGQSAAGGLPDLLGGILGGADGKVDLGDIAGILGGILGGGGATPGRTQPSQGGLGGILGGASSLGANSFLAPIINELAERLGLPPAIANAVVSFVLGKLLSGSLGRAGAASPGAIAPSQPQGLDLDHLLETVGTGGQFEPGYLRSTGLVAELAQQTGIDQSTAMQSLQEVLGKLGGQLAAGRAPRKAKASDLDHLLDEWVD